MDLKQLQQINQIQTITDKTVNALTEPIQPKYLMLKPEQYNLLAEYISMTGDAIVRNTDLIAKLPEIITAIVKGIVSLAGDMVEAGKELVNGIWKGIKENWDNIVKNVKDLGGKLVDSVKGFFKIGSPSKLFADEVGQWIPEGIAVGIDANAESVSESVDDMVKDSVVKPSIDVLGEVSGLFTPAAMGMITAPAGNDNTDSLLGQYLPLLLDAIKNSKFDVNLDGNIIARSVRKYDDSFKKANGVSMFA